jgi:hypothetical protein
VRKQALGLASTRPLLNYHILRLAEAERAPPTVVLSLPETIWTPEEWEKEDSPPPTAKPKLRPTDETNENASINPSEAQPNLVQPVPIPGGVGKPSTDDNDEGNDPEFLGPASSPPCASTSASPQPAQVVPAPSKKYRKKFFHGDECSICLNRFERGDHVRILPCGHLFHKIEVDSWLLEWKKLVSLR